MAWLNGYTYRRTVTINYTKVGSSNSTNFPWALIFGLGASSPTYLATIGNGGNVQNLNGYDIIFTSDANGLSILPFERVYWDSTTGNGEWYVNVPTVSCTSNTTFYLFYGNSSVSTDHQNVHGTWNSNFAAVYHLGDGTSLITNDSTSNANTGSNSGATEVSGASTVGATYGAASFNGTSSYISIGNGSSIKFTGPLTLSAWFLANTVHTGAGSAIVSNIYAPGFPTSTAANQGWTLVGLDFSSGGTGLQSQFWQTGTIVDVPISPGNAISGNPLGSGFDYTPAQTWVHATLVYDGSIVFVYFDGGYGFTSQNVGTNIYGNPSGENATIGVFTNLTNGHWNGYIDEVRISNTARNADWIKAEFNNLNYPVGATGSPTTIGSAGTETQSSKFQDGQSCIRVQLHNTQTGQSDVRKTTTRTQIGQSNIKGTSKQLGQGCIKKTTNRTQSGESYIVISQYQDGVSDIKATTNQQQFGVSDINNTTDRMQLGQSFIKHAQYQFGQSVIHNFVSSFQNGQSDIRKNGLQQMQNGQTDIRATSVQVQYGQSHVYSTIQVVESIASILTPFEIALATTETDQDDFFDGDTISIVGGAGFGQEGTILSYNGTTKIATVNFQFNPVPDNTTQYLIVHNKGGIKSVSLTDLGCFTTSTPSLTVTINSDFGSGAELTPVLGFTGKLPGYYLPGDPYLGFPNVLETDKVLQDDFYWQDFSYEIQSPFSLNQYQSLVEALLHPAGMMLFGSVLDLTQPETDFLKVTEEFELQLETEFFNERISFSSSNSVVIDTEFVTIGSINRDFDNEKFLAFPPSAIFDLVYPTPNQNYWGGVASGFDTLSFDSGDFETVNGIGPGNTQIGNFTNVVIGTILNNPNIRTKICADAYVIISKNISQNLFGQSRIRTTQISSQIGQSNISKIISTFQYGQSKIVHVKTLIGSSDIRVSTNRTQLGTSDIRLLVDRTQLGTSDIRLLVDRTQFGNGNIRTTTSRIQTGVSGVRNTTIWDQTGQSRIKGFSVVGGQSSVGQTVIGNSVSVTLPNNPTTGNVVCVAAMIYAGATVSTCIVKDSNNNVYNVTPSSPCPIDNGQVFLAYLLNAPSNATKTLTATFDNTPTGGLAAIFVDEFSPNGLTASFSGDAVGTGTGVNVNSPLITVSHAHELLYAGMTCNGAATNTSNSPWTTNAGGVVTNSWIAAFDVNASSSTAVNFTMGVNTTWAAIGMAIEGF